MQICMDASDWLKGFVQEEVGTGSSSPSGDLLTCPRPPVLEHRPRPQHEQALKCPRCDSTHTKFCYYNNYSLSQPRYFCKTCRRYWTKGGSLRNVPVGGGCRKNKRPSKKSTEQLLNQRQVVLPTFHDSADLHLSFSVGLMQPPHLDSLNEQTSRSNLNFMECKYNFMFDGAMNGELMMGSPGGHTFMSGCELGLGDVSNSIIPPSFNNAASSFGFSGSSCNSALFAEPLPIGRHHDQEAADAADVKPTNRILSLEWHEQEQAQQSCSDVNRDSFGYSSAIGLWNGMINGHGSSAAI